MSHCDWIWDAWDAAVAPKTRGAGGSKKKEGESQNEKLEARLLVLVRMARRKTGHAGWALATTPHP